jgi:tetratricopeptide (TPR) repeat protein
MPSDNKDAVRAKLDSLEAYIDGFVEGPDEILRALEGKTDPDSIRRRIGALIQKEQFAQAANLARELSQPQPDWVPIAITALVMDDDVEHAQELLRWADSQDAVFRQRCFFHYTQAAFKRALRNRSPNAAIVPGSITAEEANDLTSLLHIAEPLILSLQGAGRIETQLQFFALSLVLDVLQLLQRAEQLRQLAPLLLTWKPVPERAAELALQKIIAPTRDLAARLREEHGDAFRPLFLAALLDARVFHDLSTAFQEAISAASQAKTIEDKEDACELMYEIASDIDDDAITRTVSTARGLLPPSSPLLKFFEADRLFRAGDVQGCIGILQEIESQDRPQWLQLHANAMLALGNQTRALQDLRRLSTIAPHPEVFLTIGSISAQDGDFPGSIDAFRACIALDRSDIRAWRGVAKTEFARSNYDAAAEAYKEVVRLQPTDATAVTNLSASLAAAGRRQEAIESLDSLIQRAPTVELVVTKAQLLHAFGQADKAFSSLLPHEAAFWSSPSYLLAYLSLAHAAQKDDSGHRALTRLIELQAAGEVPATLLKAVSTDEVVEVLREGKARDDKTQELVVQGKAPWLLVAELLHRVAYWDWGLRTQPLKWTPDDPLNRARFSIYSTNGFRVFSREDGRRLERIVSAKCGTAVVADLSALITLHRLGILSAAAKYFDRVHIPAVYLAAAVEDLPKLMPHQRSQKTSLEQIKRALETSEIQVSRINDATPPTKVDDYSESAAGEGGITYHISDLAAALHERGSISDQQLQEVLRVAHLPPKSKAGMEVLRPGTSLIIALATLKTLANTSIFDAVLRTFQVQITDADRAEVQSGLQAFTALEQVHTWHEELWAVIRSDPAKFVVSTSSKPSGVGDRRIDRSMALAAYELGKQLDLPIVVDDRVVQALTHNERLGECSAFGSDSLLNAMCDAGLVPVDEAADHFVQLMNWRYRFIVPDAKILKAQAARYRNHPPGEALKTIARYVHDCMRDAGLLAGMESAEPPTPMAVRLFQTWSHTVAEVVISVWMDNSFTAENAEVFTQWAIQEWLPSPPMVLNPQLQARIAMLNAMTTLSHAMILSSTSTESERINRGLVSIANAFGLEQSEYLKIVTMVVSK